MQIEVKSLTSWIDAQYNFIQGIMSIPVNTEEEATRYAKCQGGVEILTALAKALPSEQHNNDTRQESAKEEEPAQEGQL